MGERPLALITGASRGIGAAVAAAVADSHDLLLGGRDLEALRRVADHDWRDSFDINVTAAAELTRLVLPALRAARGHVVLINSGSGINARAGWGPYAASKFALRAYADVLRGEETGLRVREAVIGNGPPTSGGAASPTSSSP